ncbi:MAG: N-6 DNA methylase, partial [Deltaproteobacteria bacterium]|nr:N-6 DNA methylase [Deltaproteobacteria bacterium]
TPIHLISYRQDLDRRTPGVAGAARMSPHSLVQEFLNRSDDNLWGIVSNGLRLRLLRDNASLTRQAYVEFDLEGMMSGEVYSDFILLFLLLHQSRVEAERPEQCWLERWTQEAQKQGTRALDHLRGGVEQAIATLGQGFLAHPANTSLRQKLQSGDLASYDLYQQLLRLVYRMIFLFVAEDRNLLLLPDAPAEARNLYLDHYSITRIRRLAGRLRGTRHADIWKGLRITFGCLAAGEPALGIDPLGGFLFSENALADLNDCELSNDALLTAVRNLSFTQDNKTLRPVDYRNLGTEELGSVYESLLELHPEIKVSASTFDLKIAAGSERKTTGSYYTPSSLINCLLDSALEPVIARALKESDPEKALLNLKVVDPACGSGHFLISASHRIGKHLAMIRTGEVEPPPEQRRKALRDVVSHCIYGVDLNPLAVELCKVALWIETLDPGRPLGFLDHHIKCGNSLIGATPELLEKGIPDDAFKPVEGDDKKVAAAIRKKNKEERKGQQDLFAEVAPESEWQEAVEDFQEWGSMPEHSFHEVCDKAAQYETLQDRPAYRHEKEVADLWTATFFWPLTEETGTTVPTEDIFRRFQGGDYELKDAARKRMESIATKHRFFHWHLEFPEVFSNSSPLSINLPPLAGGNEGGGVGGFDCVLGNPPWERIKLQEKEFFAQFNPEIAKASSAALRKKLIRQLESEDPTLYSAFLNDHRKAESEIQFVRNSGRYPLCGRGDINTYAIFAETKRRLISTFGSVGCVVPSGIAIDDTFKFFFRQIIENRSLVSLYDFENRVGLFPGVDGRMRFCLLTLRGANLATNDQADFIFFAHNVEDLNQPARKFSLTTDDIALINPNSRTCPIFRYKPDAELAKAIYVRIPVLVHEHVSGGNPWELRISTMFHMTNDAPLMCTQRQLEAEGYAFSQNVFVSNSDKFMPVLEGKMTGMYDHRAARIEIHPENPMRQQQPVLTTTDEHTDPIYQPLPYFWAPLKEGKIRTPNYWQRNWFPVFKRVTAATNERTVIGCIIPWTTVSYTLYLITCREDIQSKMVCLLANMNSFIGDYFVRQKTSQPSLPIGVIHESVFLPPGYYSRDVPWCKNTPLADWITKRVLELSYNAWDLEDFAKDHGYKGPPFRWDEERRFLIRCELDAAFFHLYGVKEDQLDYIMNTFPTVRHKDLKRYGEYRTKKTILELFDQMNQAINEGSKYTDAVSPSPSDSSVSIRY